MYIPDFYPVAVVFGSDTWSGDDDVFFERTVVFYEFVLGFVVGVLLFETFGGGVVCGCGFASGFLVVDSRVDVVYGVVFLDLVESLSSFDVENIQRQGSFWGRAKL